VTCLVLDDTNLGFRRNQAAWPACVGGDGAALPTHVVMRMSNPLGAGPLFERLADLCSDRLTLCFTAADLRKEYAPIGQALSWERTTSEIIKAVRERSELARVARVIVSLETDGAILVESSGAAMLIFDPQHQEGDWEQRRPGDVVAVGLCMVGALAYEAARDPIRPQWSEAITRGLLAARAVHVNGYRLVNEQGEAGEGFPQDTVDAALSGAEHSDVYQVIPASTDDRWSIFADAFPEGYAATARQIVLHGEEAACRQLPIERMGLWSSMDRTEIESMRSVRAIVREYVGNHGHTRPLNLAVFGPPGSGKSFAVKQMAREWSTAATPIDVLEFNLSQFSHLDELPQAFQRVRDCAVAGRLPLVLWDEFDTALGGTEMAWLASFLAPMQDGTFNDGGSVRPIGAAIFVFAGGTHATMSSFKARAHELAGAKATDFLSRLRGYVDIVGPNPTGEHDRAFVLRRASMLRAFLRMRAPQIFRGTTPSIDPGILNAFLHIDAYVHGSRSMETLLDMSTLTGRLRYERSALPSAQPARGCRPLSRARARGPARLSSTAHRTLLSRASPTSSRVICG
jgi:hypothetical protein